MNKTEKRGLTLMIFNTWWLAMREIAGVAAPLDVWGKVAFLVAFLVGAMLFYFGDDGEQ